MYKLVRLYSREGKKNHFCFCFFIFVVLQCHCKDQENAFHLDWSYLATTSVCEIAATAL